MVSRGLGFNIMKFNQLCKVIQKSQTYEVIWRDTICFYNILILCFKSFEMICLLDFIYEMK